MSENVMQETQEQRTDWLEQRINEIMQSDWKKKDVADIVEIATKNYVDYGASVILARSIPDLRDGLKPSQRRLLYSMKQLGLTHSGGFKKSARIVGDTIGKYHPHGDSAAYETMVNMAQPWTKNLTLVDGQGNWGSIDGDSPAAQRYTEARFTKYGSMLFRDIDKEVVDFIPNYDGSENEPTVLPAPYPQILINGIAHGSIAVGMASAMLPHNPTEVMKAIIFATKQRKKGKEVSAEDIYKYIPAPDFPTGGIVYETHNMLDIIKTGKGRVRIRAKHTIEKHGKKPVIVITEVVYGYKKSDLIKQIVNLRKEINDKKSKVKDQDKKILSNITNIRDESNKDGIRIVIELKQSADPELVWNYLLKYTALDTSISSFIVVLDTIERNGMVRYMPKEYGLLDIINRFIDFREEILEKKWTYIRKNAQAKLHILEGLLKALEIIDQVIKVIKGSKNSSEAKELLVKKFEFSEAQAQAILNMRLSKLTGLEKEELENEIKDLKAIITEATKILEDKEYSYDKLIEEFKETAKEIKADRKTEIRHDLGDIDMDKVIKKEDCVVYVTNKGYVKRIAASEISRQNKGTKGKKGIELTEDDFVKNVFYTNSHSVIMFIMQSGMVYATKAYNIPSSNKGSYIGNIFEIDPEDNIASVVEVGDFDKVEENDNLVMVTDNGYIKKSKLSEYRGSMRKSGLIGIKLRENSKVIQAAIMNKENIDVIVASDSGKAIRFEVSEVSTVGRNSIGVRAIKLKEDQKVIGFAIVEPEKLVITLAEKGLAKVSRAEEFKKQARAGTGTTCMQLSDKSGKLVSILTYYPEENKDLVCITQNGIINKLGLENLRITARNTKGFKIIKLKDGDKLVQAVLADKEKPEEIVSESNKE